MKYKLSFMSCSVAEIFRKVDQLTIRNNENQAYKYCIHTL
jgi:hypothetical protein